MIDIKECNSLILELSLFSESMIHLGSPIHDDRIENLENQIGFILPADFKYILKKHNGISLSGNKVYGIDSSFRGTSLDYVYQTEHFVVTHKMPLEFFPFSPDGTGNHYCLNLSKIKNGVCPVVFWQWDFNYTTSEEVEECNANFIDWVKEVLIDWTLEDYNYDGSSKYPLPQPGAS